MAPLVSKSRRTYGLFLLVTLAALLSLLLWDSLPSLAESKCSASSPNRFSCPRCGGIAVSDCTNCDGYSFTDYRHDLCYDRKLFNPDAQDGDSDNHYPFLWSDIAGTIVWFLTAGIATACGVGGGGIYVPMGILLLRFPPKPSSGLSQASIFGASLGGILVNIRKRHPDRFIRDTRGTPLELQPGKIRSYDKDKGPAEIEVGRRRYLNGGDGRRKFYTRPVIDYNMALFLAPMEMAGAVLGAIVQRLFPNWLFLMFAALVLGFTCHKTLRKFLSSYGKDKIARDEKRRLEIAEDGRKATPGKDRSEDQMMDDDAATIGTAASNADGENGVAGVRKQPCPADEHDDFKELEKRRQLLEEDARQYPKEKMACLLLLWAELTVITFLKGGKGVDSVIGITCEDAGFYILLAAQFVWTLGFAAVFGWKNVRATRERLEVNYPFHEGDVLWTFKRLEFYSFFTFVAGIVAGLVGIGGGMVLGPLMLVMGVNPQVSTATTATMILLTSSSVAVMFVMSGSVPWEYALYFFCVCLVGSYVGKTRIDSHVRRTGMESILVGILAAIIGLATLGCVVILLVNLNEAGWCLDGFNEFCTVKADEDDCPAARALSWADGIFHY